MATSRGAHKNRQGVETRRHLVRVAEKLFAEQGLDAVSIRAVNSAAELGTASIHYHFGSKQKLVEAVVDEHGSAVSRQVRTRARALSERAEPPTAVELVESIALPYLELLERDRTRGLRWIKLTAQLMMSNDDALVELYPEPSAAIQEQLRRAFPEVPEDRLALRWSVASRTLVQMLSQADRWTGAQVERSSLHEYVVELIDFVAGGLEAVREHDLAHAA